MNELAVITRYVRKLGGSQGAHQVTDQFERAFVVKPTDRGEPYGVKESITEFISGRLAEEIGLNVPRHRIAKLDREVIDLYPNLGGFEPGSVLSIEYFDGFDLEQAKKIPAILQGVTGLSKFSNQKTAMGIVFADSWLMNTDRGLAGLKGKVISLGDETPQKDDNVYLRKVTGVDGAWDLYAIDFGYSFRRCTFGTSTSGAEQLEWPNWLLGLMPTLFKIGLLRSDVEEHREDINVWTDNLSRINLNEVLGTIISEIPYEWHSKCSPILQGEDYQDLERRLSRSATTIEDRLESYNEVAMRYIST